jgi:hypothetical protein
MKGSTAARLAFAAGAAFLLLLVSVHLAKPELDPSQRPISEYALGDHGFLMTLAFLSWGSSAISLALALRPHVRSRGGRIGLAFLVLGGAGPLLAAIFPMDPISTPAGAMTTSGHLHSLGAVLGDGIPLGAAFITWSLVRWNPAWSSARWPLAATAALAWGGAIVMTATLAAAMSEMEGHSGPNFALGWPARFMIIGYMSWILTAAACATIRSREVTSS